MPALPGLGAEIGAERAEDEVGGHVDGVDAAACAKGGAGAVRQGEDAGLVADLAGLRARVHEQDADDETGDVIAEYPGDGPGKDEQAERDGDDPARAVAVREASG